MLKEVFMVLTQALVQTSLIQHLDITMTLPGTRSPCLWVWSIWWSQPGQRSLVETPAGPTCVSEDQVTWDGSSSCPRYQSRGGTGQSTWLACPRVHLWLLTTHYGCTLPPTFVAWSWCPVAWQSTVFGADAQLIQDFEHVPYPALAFVVHGSWLHGLALMLRLAYPRLGDLEPRHIWLVSSFWLFHLERDRAFFATMSYLPQEQVEDVDTFTSRFHFLLGQPTVPQCLILH